MADLLSFMDTQKLFYFYTHYSYMTIALTILALIVIVIVGLQSKWNGLSIIGGSTGDFGKFERRGGEKMLHNATIVLIVLFIGLALTSYFIS